MWTGIPINFAEVTISFQIYMYFIWLQPRGRPINLIALSSILDFFDYYYEKFLRVQSVKSPWNETETVRESLIAKQC